MAGGTNQAIISDSAQVSPGVIETTDIKNDAVTKEKIATNAVEAAEIATDAVEAAEIKADAVGASEIATGAVGTDEIANDSIKNEDIKSDAAIDDSKLAEINDANKVDGSALKGLANIPAGAGVIPSANLAAVISMILSTMFETAGRFSSSPAGGGSATFDSTGLVLAASASAGGRVEVGLILRSGNDLNLNIGNPIFSAHVNMVTLNAATNNGDYYIGLGNLSLTAGGIIFTDKHIGFKIIKTGGTVSLYGTVANGTTETATAALTTLADGDSLDLILKVNGTTSVDFYWRKNGGAISAATTVSTNVPTGITFSWIATYLSNKNTATEFKICNIGMTYQR